jgi:hypothetical protein
MTKLELIKALANYKDDTILNFFVIPTDGSEYDTDENDESIKFIGELHTGQVDDEIPQVDLGFINN